MSSLSFQSLLSRGAALIGIAVLLGGCVNATVDEMTYNEPVAGIGESSVVILGRRHAPDYDTEFDFIECIGDHIHSGDPSIEVINEIAFINRSIPGSSHAPRLCNHRRLIDQAAAEVERFTEMKLEL